MQPYIATLMRVPAHDHIATLTFTNIKNLVQEAFDKEPRLYQGIMRRITL